MNRLLRRLRTLALRFQRPEPTAQTGINPPRDSDQPTIDDGVGYHMPVIVPGYVQAQLSESQLKQYVESAQFRHQYGTPYADGLPVSPPTEDPLQEWSYTTRLQVLTTCQAAYHRNPLINAAVQYSADFIIGDGFNLTCKNQLVSDILYQFIDDELNAIREYERQAAIDVQKDGELFLRVFEGKQEEDAQGLIRVIPMRPWECESIKTVKGDFRSRISYRFQYEETEGDDPAGRTVTTREDIPAGEMLHIAINRSAYELRGRPELFRILTWARAHTEFVENRARQNFWRGALLWWVQIKNATAATIAAVSARWAKPPAPGSTVVTSDMQVVQPLTNNANGGEAEHDMKAIMNMVITGFRLPVYMLTDGSDANLATATVQQMPALTRFSAFQRIMVEQLWYPLFKRVLETAIEAGLIPEEVEEQDSEGETIREEPPIEQSADAIAKTTQKREKEQQDARDTALKAQAKAEPEYAEAFAPPPPAANGAPPVPPVDGGMPKPLQPDLKAAALPEGKPKMCKTVDAFEVAYEPVSVNDPKTLADMLTVATTNEWVSNETAVNELGFDYGMEQKRIARERMKGMKEVAQGLRPPPMAMRPEGMGNEPPPNGQKPPEKQAV